MSARILLLSTLLLLLGACSSMRQFAPREQLNGSGPSGAPAALYPLGDAAGRRGELRLWSDGARLVRIDGQEQTRLHLGFELENFTDQPLQLDPDGIWLQRLSIDEQGRDDQPKPVQVQGQSEAGPGQTTRFDAWFDPGAGVQPRAIDGFDVHWRVQRQDGSMAWEQATPFQPFVRQAQWDPYPWGIGFGFGYWGYPYHGWHCR